MRVVSLAEVERQIRREGARHGLYPLRQGDKVFVAQKALSRCEGRVVGGVIEELEPICSVNMAAPLGNVWRSKKRRHEYDMARLYTEARLRREAAKRREVEAAFSDRAAELRRLERRFGKQDAAEAMMLALHGPRMRRA